MYLKTVEIHGFKSFANKLVLTFNNGITGIVGPNGSGKSNVADAVRWVLGEQSAKQLRGARMEDVIFAGTELRKAQSFAYVALTIDNSDKVLPIEYEEVTVARRVYRSGESEYLINGHNCRLKDVQELFLDTGIGKEGYSIIGQGQIEKIISGRPEDRRELFDEAAGITKFKKRKSEAIKNLEEEKANLSRVKDIMSELERQIGPLSEQAETARRYLEVREELKKYETVNFITEYDAIAETRAKSEKDREAAESDIKEAEKKCREIKEEYERLEEELNGRSAAIDEAAGIISEKLVEREKLEGEMKLIKEQINSAKASTKNYDERIGLSGNKFDELVKEEEDTKLKAQALEEKDAELNALLSAQEEALSEKKRFRAEIEQRKDRELDTRARAEKEKAEAEAKAELYKAGIEQSRIKKLEINQKILRNKEISDELQKSFAESEKKTAELSENLLMLEAAHKDAEENIAALVKSRAEKEKILSEKQKEILSKKAFVKSLRNMAEKYDGYGNSVKRIMEHRSEEKGIIGVVADIIKVKANYETAIETAIGGSIQNIVTDKEETAKRTIRWLKENKFGRATFLPLDAMVLHNPGNFNGAVNEDGIIGIASSLVECEARFAGLVSHLLGRTLVADNMDSAARVARKYKYSLRIVTLEGEQLSPGGSISGGAFKNSSNLLGRSREIEEGKEELDKLEEEFNKLKDEEERIRESLVEGRKSSTIYKDRISELKVELKTEINGKKQIEARMLEVERSLDEIKLDRSNVDRECENAENEIKRLSEILEAAEDKESTTAIDGILKELEAAGCEIDDISEKINKLKLESNTVLTEKTFVNESLERIQREKERILAEIEGLGAQKSALLKNVSDKEREVHNISENSTELSRLIEEMSISKRNLTDEKDRISGEYKTFFGKMEEINKLRSSLDKELFRLNSIMEKADEGLENLVSYMADEYNITYSEVIKQGISTDVQVSGNALKKLINSHKNTIKSLGPVNVRAIEEYREISTRYELLKTQASDIVRAEEALTGIIEELDRCMREQFDERFKDINERFNAAFMELFGGGKGRLELTEGEDILEAGIKIIAQPPGKKLQNMLQLSGGEKALTAIALLFAIQNLKPSPFCLLDEIEAALDDSNVVRFAEYLHKLTKDTQFIVITHRRGTMNAADMLYGITMQEKGVSAMVSVSLIEADLEKKEKQ